MTAITRTTSTVGEVMTVDPVVVGIDSTLTEVAELLDFYAISGLPVLDWSGLLAGVISQTDIVRAEATEELSAQWARLAVRDVMTSPAITVPRGTTLGEAARLMAEQRIHRLVVVDAGDEPVGVISSSDLVRAIAEASGDEAELDTMAELFVELS